MPAVIRMPELLAGAAEAVLLTWYVSPGDEVTAGQAVAEIEADKATVDFEAEHSGVAAGLLVETGQSVAVGTPILVLAGNGESVDEAMAGFAEPEAAAIPPSTAPSTVSSPALSTSDNGAVATQPAPPDRQFATPLVRKLAREHGVELTTITGTGPGGRVVRRDLERHLAQAPTPPEPVAPQASPQPAPADETGYVDIPHTGMRRAIARRLTESKNTVPHFYLEADCRVDALLELRRTIKNDESLPVTPSVNDFVLKAVAAAFTEVPDANVVWTADAVRKFDSVSIAVAVAIGNGLVTPVIRNVERRSLGDISRTTADLAARAREGGLKQAELEGGSFAVSNLGMYGIERFSAIISPPHSGILAVGAAAKRPVAKENGELGVATMMTVTLSGDHRALDGALGARWLTAFQRIIENPLRILV
ncbi:dihydrolipoamide acetyltransferase family protein [Amycolatopsis pithecellobii]|uniref:Dihydrolipoamide acetyltransferase component of pyruvate dehydrogenase complex n=1 Tax=Amycolatopsis pithecellobii TaxID=664692 RepID=A0A6N7Z2H8_9PSEU|nr:dihydrolipoamide acetyltransferase family protein [Amycolatopsis pithecellobii]MTD55119.1 pyruvate dehydrogenase complex dihydrolipoamide acetyltransferase [Amycolatopsis pithecellobii]